MGHRQPIVTGKALFRLGVTSEFAHTANLTIEQCTDELGDLMLPKDDHYGSRKLFNYMHRSWGTQILMACVHLAVYGAKHQCPAYVRPRMTAASAALPRKPQSD